MKHGWSRIKEPIDVDSSLPRASRDISLKERTIMDKYPTPLLMALTVLTLWVGLPAPGWAGGQPLKANGIQPLIQLNGGSLHQLVPEGIRSLLLPQEQEQFLQELESVPPDWHTLQGLEHTEQSEQLFQLNRERDQARLVHAHILQQPIAFLWSGILRQYLPEYGGFSIALGPDLTRTSWGIVRFKPMELPDYLVAIPPGEAVNQLLLQQQHGEQIEIGVLFIGTLVTDESLIYDFSHDDKEDGMILPIVQIQGVKYFLRNPINPVPIGPLAP